MAFDVSRPEPTAAVRGNLVQSLKCHSQPPAKAICIHSLTRVSPRVTRQGPPEMPVAGELAPPLPHHGTRRSISRRGAGRRTNSGRRKAVVESSEAKTSLVAEWRAHEENEAARVIQRGARIYLSRQWMVQLVLQIYEKHFDPVQQRFFYVNTRTNESSWEKPALLSRLLNARDVRQQKGKLSVTDAAVRIQRQVRALVARRAIKQLVRENYMKLFDSEGQTFYYLNTRTGATSDQKPPFFRTSGDAAEGDKARKSEDDDLEIEPFHFRKAVCKLTTTADAVGSAGVLGRFCGILCLLCDARTLPTEDVAQSARVTCNFATDRVAFPVLLASEHLFANVKVPLPRPKHHQNQRERVSTAQRTALFTICAVNEAQFAATAGANIKLLRFEVTDRKLGCCAVTSLSRGDAIEVVGHPHGKMQVVHKRRLADLAPNAINPQQLVYDTPTESGSAGSAVFTRGGKLIGIQQHEPAVAGPRDCWAIHPILEAATALVMPPEPFILTACVSSTDVQVYWQIERSWTPLRGLDVTFELELCRHAAANDTQHHDKFENVYTGPRKSRHLSGLNSETMYSLRCRAVNRMKKSGWSTPARLVTLPQASMAWRLQHCRSVAEAVKRMREHSTDPLVQFRSMQWLIAQLDRADDDETSRRRRGEELELEIQSCNAFGLLLEVATCQTSTHETIVLALRLLSRLAELGLITQRWLSHMTRFQMLCDLLRRHCSTDGKSLRQEEEEGSDVLEKSVEQVQVPVATLALLGYVLATNASAKQMCVVCEALPLVLSFLERDSFRHQPLVVAECCYLLAKFSHQNESGKWEVVRCDGLVLLRDVLEEHRQESRILYWTLVTLGNLAYGLEGEMRGDFEARVDACALVASICGCKIHFVTSLHELELSLTNARKLLERLQATHIGEEMRNELDASEHAVATLEHIVDDWKSHNVAEAADYALQYVLTEEQRRVQAASIRIMNKVLLRKMTMAIGKWLEVTEFERQRGIIRVFLQMITARQLRPAFRRWEQVVHAMRKHKTLLQVVGSGLAMDLTKTKRERYRMLVLQK